MTTRVFVSSKNMSCVEIATTLRELGLAGHVRANATVQPGGQREHGCEIVLRGVDNRTDAATLWRELKRTRGEELECAYVDTHVFKGCILDYLRPSLCSTFSSSRRLESVPVVSAEPSTKDDCARAAGRARAT